MYKRNMKTKVSKHINVYVYPSHLVSANTQILKVKTKKRRPLIELLIKTKKHVSIDNNDMHNNDL